MKICLISNFESTNYRITWDGGLVVVLSSFTGGVIGSVPGELVVFLHSDMCRVLYKL